MKLRKDRDILDTAQLVVTIATAVVALRLNYLQGELSRRIQRESITQTYAEKILSHLEDLKMDPAQRGTVVIDVLDIITEANLNVGERPYSDTERQQLIPLRLALATHDADLIAHIGTDKRKRKLWTEMAIQSGNDEIKSTAIRALAQIGRYRGRVAELETFSFCVEKILELSENFARAPLSREAIEQFTVMVEVAGKVPILLEDEALKAVIQRGRDALIVAAGSAIQERAEQQQVQPPEATPTPGLKPASLPHANRGPEMIGLQAVANRLIGNSQLLLAANRPAEESAEVLSAAQKALRQLDDLNLKQAPARPQDASQKNLAAPINDLKSDDIGARRGARQELARSGAASVQPLLEALRKEPDVYRIRLGVSYALYKINEPVRITKSDDASQLVGLAGDSESEVRQYASEFLMRLSDAESIKTIRPELEKVIGRELAAPAPNGNALYNAVVILGTWMRTLPSELAAEKAAIARSLRDLKPKLSQGNQWGKTLALIDELNAAAPETTPPQN